MRNIVSNIDMGYSIPNLKKLVNTIANVFNIESEIFIIPLRVKKLDENSYVVPSINSFIIYVNEKYLREDKITNFVIRMFIHEMWHVKQMMEGRLKFNYDNTKAIFEGKEYTNLMAHGDRPFEVEARKAEDIYFKQVKKIIITK